MLLSLPSWRGPMSNTDEMEWFIGAVVAPKKDRTIAGFDPDDTEDAATSAAEWGKEGQITAGYHNPDEPHTTLVFEVNGWWWYAHDLEAR